MLLVDLDTVVVSSVLVLDKFIHRTSTLVHRAWPSHKWDYSDYLDSYPSDGSLFSAVTCYTFTIAQRTGRIRSRLPILLTSGMRYTSGLEYDIFIHPTSFCRLQLHRRNTMPNNPFTHGRSRSWKSHRRCPPLSRSQSRRGE